MKLKRFEELNEEVSGLGNAMTVGVLKNILEKYPEDMLVGIYCWEDGDLAASVTTNKEEELYYKGDSIENIYEVEEEILIIKGVNES